LLRWLGGVKPNSPKRSSKVELMDMVAEFAVVIPERSGEDVCACRFVRGAETSVDT